MHSKKASYVQGTFGGIFLILLFGFYIYAYGIASALLEYKVINPVTGEPYGIQEIVAVS